MIEDLSEMDEPKMAVSSLHPSSEMDYYLAPPFERIGTVVHLVMLNQRENGTWDTLCMGLERASFEECPSSDDRPYRRVNATLIPLPAPPQAVIDWLNLERENIARKLSTAPEGGGLYEELYSRLDSGELDTRVIINILCHLAVGRSELLQDILEDDSCEAAHTILQQWLNL